MSDYTPNTDVVRQACTFERNRLGEPRTIKVEAFERWLEGVKAEAWERGYDAGVFDTRNPPRRPVEDDFGDASIQRAMIVARARGDEPAENKSRLKPKEGL